MIEDIHSDEIGSEFDVPSEPTLTEDDDIDDMASETHATTDEIDSTIRTPDFASSNYSMTDTFVVVIFKII